MADKLQRILKRKYSVFEQIFAKVFRCYSSEAEGAFCLWIEFIQIPQRNEGHNPGRYKRAKPPTTDGDGIRDDMTEFG